MSAPQVRDEHIPSEVASLVLPMAGRSLVLPTVTVAEMVPYVEPMPEQDAPNWYLGSFSWRYQSVPLLSFEVLNGEMKPTMMETSRVAVLNNTGVCEDVPFIGIVTQGIPRLSRVTPEEISVNDQTNCKPFELMHVVVAGEELVIPDISALEKVYMDLRSGR